MLCNGTIYKSEPYNNAQVLMTLTIKQLITLLLPHDNVNKDWNILQERSKDFLPFMLMKTKACVGVQVCYIRVLCCVTYKRLQQHVYVNSEAKGNLLCSLLQDCPTRSSRAEQKSKHCS